MKINSNKTKKERITKLFLSIYLKNKKIILLILCALLIILYLFPRSIELLNQNPIFGFDQGREYLAARNIIVNHKFILIGTELGAGSAGINGVFHGPIYYYLLTIPFVLFAGNPAGGTVLIFLLNLLAGVFMFYFVKKLFGFFPALLSAFLFSVSPIFISQARFLWSPNPPALFILLSFYFTYLFFQKNNLYVFLAAFFAAFVYNFEMGIAIPLVLGLFIYSIYSFKTFFVKYIYLAMGFIFGFLPMIIFETRHNFLGVRGVIAYLGKHETNKSVSYGRLLFEHFNAIILNLNNTFGLQQISNKAIFYIPAILLFVTSIYFLREEKNKMVKNLVIFFFITIITTFFVLSRLNNALYGYYLTDLSLSYILIFVYVVWASYMNRQFKVFYPFVAFALLFIFCSLPFQIKTSVADYSDYGGTAKLKGKVDAIDYIYKDAAGKQFGLLVFTPPVYTYPYDYIIDWYGRKKFGYTPYKDKKGVFYLLIERDPDKPWSYKGWLETVIKVGKVDYTRELRSGFVVQKREL